MSGTKHPLTKGERQTVVRKLAHQGKLFVERAYHYRESARDAHRLFLRDKEKSVLDSVIEEIQETINTVNKELV